MRSSRRASVCKKTRGRGSSLLVRRPTGGAHWSTSCIGYFHAVKAMNFLESIAHYTRNFNDGLFESEQRVVENLGPRSVRHETQIQQHAAPSSHRRTGLRRASSSWTLSSLQRGRCACGISGGHREANRGDLYRMLH